MVHQEAHVLPEVEEREEVQPNSPQDSAIATSPQNGSHPKIGAALDRGPTNEYDSTANKVDSEDQELVPNDKDRVYPSRPSSPTPLSGQHGRAEDAAVNDPEPTQEPGHTLPKENQTHSAAPSESQTTTAPAIEPLIIRDPKDPSYSLSTFSPKAIRVGQRVFGSVEAALQATKFADVDKRDALWASSGAWMAFSQAQSWAFYVRPDWFSHGHDEVLRALQTLKASQVSQQRGGVVAS